MQIEFRIMLKTKLIFFQLIKENKRRIEQIEVKNWINYAELIFVND